MSKECMIQIEIQDNDPSCDDGSKNIDTVEFPNAKMFDDCMPKNQIYFESQRISHERKPKLKGYGQGWWDNQCNIEPAYNGLISVSQPGQNASFMNVINFFKNFEDAMFGDGEQGGQRG